MQEKGENGQPSLTSVQKHLEQVYWLIERNDDRRASIANRAAIVVSADALLMAGATFAIGQVFQEGASYLPIEQSLIIFTLGVTIFLLTLSIFNAANGIASVWKLSRKVGDLGSFRRLFVHAYDTVETLGSFEEYSRKFKATDQDQMLEYALGYLWAFQNIFHQRYEILRRAIRLLLVSLIPYLASIVMLVVFPLL